MSAAPSIEERMALLAALKAQVAAVESSLYGIAPVAVGNRVAFEVRGETFMARVHRVGEQAGESVAWLTVPGHSFFHIEPLTRLRRICDRCTRLCGSRPECSA